MAERGAAELDDQRRVVGIGGLSLLPTRHELTRDGVALHTWCALDAWHAAAGQPAGEALSVAEAAERGRAYWAQDARWGA